jgi:hypothetical protein
MRRRRLHRRFVLLVALLLVFTTGASGSDVAGPRITGTAVAGQTLTADTSSWSGVVGPFSFQWLRCDSSGAACTVLSGATASTYGVSTADVGMTLRVKATGKTSTGTSITATSSPTAVVAPAPATTLAPAPVSLTNSVANGSTLSGSVKWIAQTSGSGIARIDFLVDGAKRWTEAYAPYYYNGDPNGVLDTKTLSNGSHTLTTVAYNTSAAVLARASSGVSVNNTSSSPTPSTGVTLANSIASGATIRGSVQWIVSASGTGIARIDFLIDGSKRWAEAYAPYYFNGDPAGVLDTKTLADGAHTLLAVAYNSSGAELARVSSGVTVANSTTTTTTTTTTTSTTSTSSGTGVYSKPWPRYGISPGYTILNRSSSSQDYELDQIVKAGAKAVRLDYVEPAKADVTIAKAMARGLEVELGIGGTMRAGTTLSATAFGSRCSAAASKYDGRVRFYEPMNEPNGAWNGPWNPATFVAYQRACYQAIKQVDSRAIVLMSGIAPAASIAPAAWVQQIYAAGAKGTYDVMNLHLYGDPAVSASWSIWCQTFGCNGVVSANVVSTMAAHGDGALPIVSTEGGDNASQVGETNQAAFVDRNLRDPRIRQSYIYCMLDDATPGFGLEKLSSTGQWVRRPAFTAMQSVTGGTG